MFRKKRLHTLTFLYWFLLLYIIAALLFWFLELDSLNRQLIESRLSELVPTDPQYDEKLAAIMNEQRRKSMQFLGEGIVFLAVIIIGAVFMSRVVRKQFTLQKQQENFMMAITHELKTPIAVAKLNLETLQKHQLDESKKQRLLQMTLQETNRLNALASNILVSAQLEEGKPFPKEELDFSDLVKNSVQEFTNRFPNRNWIRKIKDEMELAGDPLLLQILVNNLLENAVKYSPVGSTITCALDDMADYITLSVSDEGPGIAEHEKRRVFRKFYRIGSEETRSAKGTGLGLYLCKKIADDHHAVIRISENKPRGSVFMVRFNKEVSGQ